jgi:DNA-binding NtrC family response regulator
MVVAPSGELTDTLYADTLFGHVAGAFTSASASREGVVEWARNGTLLLDDLTMMSVAAQASLLRVLETGRFRPLGSSTDRPSTTRFLFATTVDLPDLVALGSLLPDLESRVGELVIYVPGLAERSEDIPPLAAGLASIFLAEHGYTGHVEITVECQDLLMRYPWPTNVRELRGVMERAIIHAGPTNGTVVLRPGHLPDRFHQPFEDGDSNSTLTRSLVESVLHEVAGNRSEAARRLGVHRNTVARYLKTAG